MQENWQKHFLEIRNRLFFYIIFLGFTVSISYVYVEVIYAILLMPLVQAQNFSPDTKIIFTSLPEAFFSYTKLAFFSGFFLSTPFLSFQIYKFISPALDKKEFKILLFFTVGIPIMFFLGALIAYTVIMPLAWNFFLSFENKNLLAYGDNRSLHLTLEHKISEYLSLSTHIITATGISFQLPFVLYILDKLEIVTNKTLKEKRKLSFVLILLFSALITPPDLISQICVTTPMLILYEASIFITRKSKAEITT